MKITILGGCGAWPAAGQACGGYLVEHDGFRLLVDPGYAILPRLLAKIAAEQVNAVLVSHGHPDHCADLNPLLRARALADEPAPALSLYAPPGALDAVLALDGPRMLADAFVLREFVPGGSLEIGPFGVGTRLLPHHVANAGVRISADGCTLAYTGDSGPSPDIVELARDVDLLIAEATFVDQVPAAQSRHLSSARQAGQRAAEAAVGRLVLTHLWPGTAPVRSRSAAADAFGGRIDVARPELTLELG